MESDLFKYTNEHIVQSRLKTLKLLNSKGGNSKGSGRFGKKFKFEFTVEDDEILDPRKLILLDDEETWLYKLRSDDTNNTSRNESNSDSVGTSSNIWEWLRFSRYDIELSKKYCNSSTSLSDSLLASFSDSSNTSSILDSFSQGKRNNVIDSRTYTRPKKRSFQTIVGRDFDNSFDSDIVGNGLAINNAFTTTETSESPVTATTTTTISTNNIVTESPNVNNYTFTTKFDNCISNACTTPSYSSSPFMNNSIFNRSNNTLVNRTNDSCMTSLGIIDIDELTNSQLGFNNVLNSEEAESMLAPGRQPLQEQKSLTPFTVSDKSRLQSQQSKWKYKLDESLITSTELTITNNELTVINNTNTNENNQPIEKSKIFNSSALELLKVSFPNDYVNFESSSPSLTTSITNDQNKCDEEKIKNIASNIKTEHNAALVNNETFNNSDIGVENYIKQSSPDLINHSNVNTNSSVNTPPQQESDFNNPLSNSTPTHGRVMNQKLITNSKGAIKYKPINYNTYKKDNKKPNSFHENGISGRLSDSSTDTDIQSTSMEDLNEEEQISPILNRTYNANPPVNLINTENGAVKNKTENNCTNILNQTQILDRTCEVSPNNTGNLTKSHNALNFSAPVLTQSFRKSPLNKTFCMSTEAINGTIERADSGPEDDCMSTASDSSFSSSSTHMRSVGEIQSIARLQEESLRQAPPKRKLAWGGGSDGLQDSSTDLRRSVTKIPSDDGNHSDQSDRSSDRYSPTTVNNNDKSALSSTFVYSGIRPPKAQGIKQFGGSSEVLNTTVNTGAIPRTSGLRPPRSFNKIPVQPPPPQSMGPPAQPAQIRLSGIRPPSVIPRPVSRLPCRMGSGLPKYNARGGRQ